MDTDLPKKYYEKKLSSNILIVVIFIKFIKL